MAQPRVGSTMTGSLASTSGPTQTNPLPVQVLMASSSSLVPCLQLSAPFSPLLAARATFRARQPLPHHAPRTSCYAPRTPATPLAPPATPLAPGHAPHTLSSGLPPSHLPLRPSSAALSLCLCSGCFLQAKDVPRGPARMHAFALLEEM